MQSVASKLKPLFWLLVLAISLLTLTGCGTQRGSQRPEEPQKPRIAQAKPLVLMEQAASLPTLPPPTPTKGLSPEDQARVVASDYVDAANVAGRCLLVVPGLLEWIKRQE